MTDAVISESSSALDRAAPRARRSAISADQLLDAAEGVLCEGGFEHLSVRSIAGRVGASRQVVYTHFGGMDGLLDALHRRLSARLCDAVDAVVPVDEAELGGTIHVLAAVAAYRDVARQWPELYQLVFEQPVADYVVGSDAVADGRRAFTRIVRLSEQWLQRRAQPLEPGADTELARALWSAVHGFVVVERVGFASVAETDGLSDRSIESMLAGW